MDLEEARKVLEALERERVRYVLVGALAMAAHGLVRATQDMDLFVAVDDDNIARLRRALTSVFSDPHIEEITVADLAGDYPAIQYVAPGGVFAVDILARLGEAFRFEDLEIERVPLAGGVEVAVASPMTLYRMKHDTVRPQDRLDASALRRRFALDVDTAGEADDEGSEGRR